MYESEGISCDQIVFQDNQPCLDLIEKKSYGILSKLDEELIVPNGSDAKVRKHVYGIEVLNAVVTSVRNVAAANFATISNAIKTPL